MILIEQEPAFLLHRRDYRDTSNLLTVLTLNHGRLTLIAQGARRPKSPLRALLQPFQRCDIGWRETKSDLALLVRADLAGSVTSLTGSALLAGLYINEILMRLLPGGVSDPVFFEHYYHAIKALMNCSNVNLEDILRIFEKNLLLHLGYGLDLWHDKLGNEITPDGLYHYFFEQNFIRWLPSEQTQSLKIPGDALCNLRSNHIEPQHRFILKTLFRQVLQHYLGEKPLIARQLWGPYD